MGDQHHPYSIQPNISKRRLLLMRKSPQIHTQQLTHNTKMPVTIKHLINFHNPLQPPSLMNLRQQLILPQPRSLSHLILPQYFNSIGFVIGGIGSPDHQAEHPFAEFLVDFVFV